MSLISFYECRSHFIDHNTRHFIEWFHTTRNRDRNSSNRDNNNGKGSRTLVQGCYSNLESVRAGWIPTQLTVWKQLAESSTVCGWNEGQLRWKLTEWVDYLRVSVPVLLTFIAPCTVCVYSQFMLIENTYSGEYNTEIKLKLI